MQGYKESTESFMLFNTIGKPLTAKTLAVICNALNDHCIESDWLVSHGEGHFKFDLCEWESEVNNG